MIVKINLLTLSIFLICGCTSLKDEKYIPGIYVNTTSSDFNITTDLLTIEPSNSSIYLIHREKKITEIVDFKFKDISRKVENWKGIYNHKSNIIIEIDKGRELVFYREAHRLIIGDRVYKKIN